MQYSDNESTRMSKRNSRPNTRNSEDANAQRVRPDTRNENDPLLASQGSGRHLWADERADDYVRRLRENWNSSEVTTQRRKVSARRNTRRGRSGPGGR